MAPLPIKPLEDLSDTAHAKRGEPCEQIASELKAHAEIEEKIFYPAFKAKTKIDRDPVDEVREA